jgi:hypothetical protein
MYNIPDLKTMPEHKRPAETERALRQIVRHYNEELQRVYKMLNEMNRKLEEMQNGTET